MSDLDDSLDYIARFPTIARDLLLGQYVDEARVDVLGTIRSAEVGLADVRKLGASEIEPGTRGERFEFEQGRQSTKTYNTSSLLAKFMRAYNLDPLTTLLRLIDMDVVRLSWQYKKLLAAVEASHISLTTTNNEIEDGDPNIDIGKVWKNGYPRYVAIEPKEGE